MAMNCDSVKNLLGPYLDDELAAETRGDLQAHLASCSACSKELAAMRSLASDLSDARPTPVPGELWPAIERALDEKPAQVRHVPVGEPSSRRFVRGRLAMAASVLLFVGLGLAALAWLGAGVSRVQADVVDYRVLLDALPLDPGQAFRKFLVLYHARELTPQETKRYAPDLSFDVPETLPGGFSVKSVYGLRFQDAPGVAAEYERDGEFLGVIFHSPVHREDYGTHKDAPCVIGKHRGHKVEVGRWKLVHFTDPTTCHCVLSRLSEEHELPAVVAAIAPKLGNDDGQHHHSAHPH